MATSNKQSHLTLTDRVIIQTGIQNGSTKVAIANTIGKDKSTIGKEIKSHRQKRHCFSLPLECKNYKHCKHGRCCKTSCPSYVPFRCSRRDRSPGACNGCPNYKNCRYDKYIYSADLAEKEYQSELKESREGINCTEEDIVRVGNIIQPLIKQGLSPYAILQSHPEIKLSEKTIYTYIEKCVFKNAGVDLIPLNLRRQVSRKPTKDIKNKYKKRKDRSYLKNRTYKDYLTYMEQNPNAKIVEMDTVYNKQTGPFMQTFKFLKYSFMVILFHKKKDAQSMYEGILLLEKILGEDLFDKEVQVLKTDRGSEFTMANEIETRDDGTLRTRVFYCDPMQSGQKGSLENNHEEIRYICPKEVDLYCLGLKDQESANKIASNINSFPKEKLEGKTPFQLLEFFNKELKKKFIDFGINEIDKNKVILKPFLLK